MPAETDHDREVRGQSVGQDERPRRPRPPSPIRTMTADDAGDDGPARAIPPARRRRAAEALIAVWMDVARDLALVGAEGRRPSAIRTSLRSPSAAASGLGDGAARPASWPALERGAELVAGNVSPELVLDSLALAWPERRAA